MPSWTNPPQAPDPTPGKWAFEDVLPWELKCVFDRRHRVWKANGAPEAAPTVPPPAPVAAPAGATAVPVVAAVPPPPPAPPRTGLEKYRHDALDMGLVGLALSGGGIRSASVGLGFLQGLGRLRLLRVFDYLSTVSGGGYTGGWLAAWVQREHDRDKAPPGDKSGLANVELQLDPGRVSEAEAARYHRDKDSQETDEEKKQNTRFVPQVDQEPEPVYHVRAYSNYLTPRGGVFSTDTWVLAAIYLRNTLVNLLIVLLMAAAVVALSRLAVWGYAQGVDSVERTWWEDGRLLLTIVALVLGAGAVLFILWNRIVVGVGAGATGGKPAAKKQPREYSTQEVRWLVVIPLVVAAALATWCLSENPAGGHEGLRFAGAGWFSREFFPPAAEGASPLKIFSQHPALFYAAAGAVAAAVVGILGALLHLLAGAGKAWTTILSTMLFGALVGIFSFYVLDYAIWNWTLAPALLATLGPPLLLAACVLAGFVEQWIFYGFSPYEREWRSRLAADLMIAAAVWLIFFGTTLYLPGLFDLLSQEVRRYVTGAVVVGWVGTVLGGVFASRSRPADPTAAGSGVLTRVLGAVAPPLFLIGVLALLSIGLSAALRDAVGQSEELAALSKLFGFEVNWSNWMGVAAGHGKALGSLEPYHALRGELGGGVWVGLTPDHWRTLGVVALGLAGCSLFISRFADVNVFSMHALYGNRLVRCFLAASRRKEHENPDPAGRPRRSAPFGVRGGFRHANAYTGFDAGDDLPLHYLRPLVPQAGGKPVSAYDGPYPLFGTTLNLIAGQDLALRDRKGAAFVLTPDFCGSEATGYARTPDGADGANLTVGRAMTISGAAADASMPLQSSALRALMALFNARLGWWMQNPREAGAGWVAASPTLGVLSSLYRELFGLTDDRGQTIHLSDGGHFDNSGVYELVRRRCRFIVALDADVDPLDAPENLAMMVQRVRTDFGVRIDIDTLPLQKDAAGKSKWHVAVGSIRYDEVDRDAVAGTFVFVRASMTGDEPADLRNYAIKDPRFPHHPTFPEQFFDEGQFESYRALGDHIAETVFGEAAARFDADRLRGMNHLREVRRLFSLVRNQYFPPPPNFDASYVDAGKAFAELMGSLRADPKMNRLTHDMYPEVARLTKPPFRTDQWVGHDVERAEVTAVNHILDVMEMVWVGIDLDGHFSHPLHSGWMGSFRRWAAAETFQKYWPVVRGEYSREFVRFCERILNLPAVKVKPVQITELAPGVEWEKVIARLDREYVAEWAGTLSEIEQYEDARAKAHAARRTATPRTATPRIPVPKDLKAAVTKAHAYEVDGKKVECDPLVWFLTLDDPPKGADAREVRVEAGAATRTTATPAAKPADAPAANAPAANAPAADAPGPEEPSVTIGILVVYPVTVPAGETPCYEVLFWLRGAYRSLGLGRQAIEARMPEPEPEAVLTAFLAKQPAGAHRPAAGEFKPLLHEYVRLRLKERHPNGCRLIARYPVTGKTAADRVQRVRWQNFFYDYEFRRVHGDPKGRYVTLQYAFDLAEVAIIHTVMHDRAAHGE